MKIEEKMDLIVSLLKEVAQDFDKKAESIKDLDEPLYRMLTEGGSKIFKEMYKNLYISGDLDTFKARLKFADKLLSNEIQV
jgi:hypothetical protein